MLPLQLAQHTMPNDTAFAYLRQKGTRAGSCPQACQHLDVDHPLTKRILINSYLDEIAGTVFCSGLDVPLFRATWKGQTARCRRCQLRGSLMNGDRYR